MSGKTRPYRVLSVWYTQAAPGIVRANYALAVGRDGMRVVWQDLDIEGDGRDAAALWWALRTRQSLPATAAEALRAASELPRPRAALITDDPLDGPIVLSTW